MSNWDSHFALKTSSFSSPYKDNYSEETDILVSVIFTAFNQEKFVEQALKSIISQTTNFRFEIIAHDDASSDSTPTIIKKYADLYPDLIIPILQKENQMSKGVSIIRSFVLPCCHGRYIAFLEGDDYWIDNRRLQNQLDVMLSNPNVSLCVGKTQYIDERTGKNDKMMPGKQHCFVKGIIPFDVYNRELWINWAYFHTSTFLMKRELLVKYYNLSFGAYMNGDQAWLRLGSFIGDIYFFDSLFSFRRIMVSNSWNKWFNDSDASAQAKWHYKRIIGSAYFDNETNKKFHKYISIDILRGLWNIAGFNKASVKETLKIDKIRMKDLKPNGVFKDKVKLFLLKYFLTITYIFLRRNQKRSK